MSFFVLFPCLLCFVLYCERQRTFACPNKAALKVVEVASVKEMNVHVLHTCISLKNKAPKAIFQQVQQERESWNEKTRHFVGGKV